MCDSFLEFWVKGYRFQGLGLKVLLKFGVGGVQV